jgi:hypothetical protein
MKKKQPSILFGIGRRVTWLMALHVSATIVVNHSRVEMPSKVWPFLDIPDT